MDGCLRGSGGDVDGRREVHGPDGVVAADVWRGEADAHPLSPAPQHTGCGARVRWLPPFAAGEARGQHRPMHAGAGGQGEGRDAVTTAAVVG